VPAWVASLQEQVHKVARAQSKLSLRLDELMHLLDERLAARAADPPSGELDPAPVLDVLDRLDEARRTLAVERPAVEQGLASIGARLEGFLGAMGIERRATLGVPADPKLFRVVGVEATSEATDGSITRVIRAAALRGARLIREGEVLVGRRSSP
jgi:GrpE